MKHRKLKWIPDVPDGRDYYFTSPKRRYPTMVDLSERIRKIWDQGNIGSCTAQATAAQCWAVDETAPYEPSRLFLYFATRLLEGTTPYDGGASIRNSIKAAVRFGLPPETSWPYLVRRFAERPPKKVFDQAKHEIILEYGRVLQAAPDILGTLVHGCMVNLGIGVYPSFYDAGPSGLIPMPKAGEPLLGGHAVLLVGYDYPAGMYKFLNSWGRTWGRHGYGFLPFDYVHNSDLAGDLWAVRKVA